MAEQTGETDLVREFEELTVSKQNWKFKHVVVQNPLSEQMMTSTDVEGHRINMHLRFDSPHEAYIEITVAFDTQLDSPYSRNVTASKGTPPVKGVHYKAVRFYWHAFEASREDITLSKVTELDDSMGKDSFLAKNLEYNTLWLLTLTYNPDNLVDFHLNENAEYLNKDVAQGFIDSLRSLKCSADAGEATQTINVYFSDSGAGPMMQTRFDRFVARLADDRAAPCLSEYHRTDGSPLLNWGDSACDYDIDRERLLRKTRFRTHEDNLLTHGIGELREAGATFDLLPIARVTKLQMHFIAIGDLDEHLQSWRYLAVGQGYHDSKLRSLLEIGEVGTLTFAPPNHRFPPLNGWKYTVRSPLPQFGVSNELVLDVSRNIDDNHTLPMKTLEDEIKLDQDIYLSPDPSDVSGKLLVHATKRMIQGIGPHFDKLRGYMSGQDFSPSDTCRFMSAAENPPTHKDSQMVTGIMHLFNSKQLEAAKHLVRGNHMLQLVQGPPGTGKTWWTAQMIKICHIAKIPVLATAPSNAAANALLEHLVRNDQNAGYEVRPLRFAGQFDEVKAMIAAYLDYHRIDEPDMDQPSTPESAVLDQIDTADDQHRSKRFAGHLDPSSFHTQILEQAGILVNNRLDPSTDFDEDHPLAKFRRLFLDPNSPIYASDLPEDEEEEGAGEGYEETHGAGGETTVRVTQADDKPKSPTISSVSKKAIAVVAGTAACVVTTCVSAGLPFISINFHPRVVFVDEAGTARVAETCNAIIGAMERKELAILCLVGDTSQLRPLVVSKYSITDSSEYGNPMAEQQQTSLMAQLKEENYPSSMFLEQRRMVVGLKEFSSVNFYHGRLLDGPGTAITQRRIARSALRYLSTEMNLASMIPSIFVNVAGGVTTTTRSESRANPYNLIATLDIVRGLVLSRVCTANEITILTPYNSQRRAYHQAIAQLDVFQGLTVKTIDSFQGSEQQVVIFDLVISHIRKGKTGFIQDYRRLNVALTRGRDCTIVVGDLNCLQDVEKEFLDKQAERQAQQGDESQLQDRSDDVNISGEMKSTLLSLFKFYAGTNSIFEIPASQLRDHDLAEGMDFTDADEVAKFSDLQHRSGDV